MASKVDGIKKEVLQKIKPGSAETKNVRTFIRDLLRIAKLKTGLDAVIVGSTGKGSWLSGDHDIDLFILFPKSMSRDDLEGQGLTFGKEIVKEMKGEFKIKFAEHPYVHAVIDDFDVDIVPCYRIEKGEKIKSAVDRSPLHLEYIITNMGEKMADDVRLLKQFMKGSGVYSSDTKNLGFSGYICELLILHYGSFEKVLKAAAKWGAPQVIDVKKHFRKIIKAKEKFKDQPFIVIDPVDKNRNAGAIVSAENFMRFVTNARKFNKEPSKDYFFPPKSKPLSAGDVKKLKARGTKFIAITMKRPDVIDDVIFPQLRRARKRLENILSENEFHVMRSYIWANERTMTIVFELEVWALPHVKKMTGPNVFSKKHVKEFLTKYKSPEYGPYIDNIEWVIEKKRESETVTTLLERFLSNDPNDLREQGIPNKICKEMFNSRIVEDNGFWVLMRKEKELSAFMRTRYFEGLC